jgi:opacity protein-like surface antigen
MKKLVFAAVAAIALMASVSFVSCDQKAAPATDSVAVDTTVVEDTIVADTLVADTVVADTIAE